MKVHQGIRGARRWVAVGCAATLITVLGVATRVADAVTVGTATTNFEIEPTAPAPVSPFAAMVAPGAAPGTDWAGTGAQSPPALVVYNDANYTGLGGVPTDLTSTAINGACTATQDNTFGAGQKINTHPINSIIGAAANDKSDVCQIFTGYESAVGAGGTDIIFYLALTTKGNSGSNGSVTLWYELNQIMPAAQGLPYRSVGDILLGFEYFGNTAGTVKGYKWTGSGWNETTFPVSNYQASTPAAVNFAEMAINLTNAGLLNRPTGVGSCQSFIAGRGMTSASQQPNSDGKDLTDVYRLTNSVSNCGQLYVSKQTLPEDPNSGAVDYPNNVGGPAYGFFGIEASGGPSGSAVLTGSIADNGTAAFTELFGGGYVVKETALPSSDFEAVSFTCTQAGASVGTTNATFTEVSGLTVSSNPTYCTVTNAKKSALTIEKTSTGPTGSFAFNLYNSTDLATAVAGSPLSVSTATTNPNTASWPNTLSAGTYVLKEANPSPTWKLTALQCTVTKGDASANVVTTGTLADGVSFTVAAGDQVACEATNQGDLTISIRKATTPAGGTGFGFTSTSTPATFSLDDGGSQLFTVVAGSYVFTEDAVPGYRLTDIVCTGATDSTITKDLANRRVTIGGAVGENVVCTFQNEKLARVSVTKTLVGISGVWTFDFSLSPAGSNTNPKTVTNGAPTATWIDLAPGSYTMTEVNLPAGFRSDTLTCGTTSATGTTGVAFTLAAGDELSCSAANTELGSLKVIKQTSPDGSPKVFDFDATSLTPGAFQLSDGEERIYHNLAPGTYGVTEAAAGGWNLASVTCTGATSSAVTTSATGMSVVLSAGEHVVCTFQNNETPRLRVVKSVTNDNGGNAAPTDFSLSAAPLGAVTHNVYHDVAVATEYTISEAALAGYSQTGIGCVDDDTTLAVGSIAAGQAKVTLAFGQDVTCTIANDDIAPTLKVVKSVTNNDGGNAIATDFTLRLNDGVSTSTVTHNVSNPVDANKAYTASELAFTGYTQTAIVCTDDSDGAELSTTGTLTLNEGQNATCTISNDDVAPKLTVVKTVINDDGGNAVVADFPLSITKSGGLPQTVTSSVVNNVAANSAYTVSETLVTGYTQTGIACVITGTTTTVGSGGVVTLDEGQDVTCTVTNNDVAPKLKVVKVVNNLSGGNAVIADFPLTLSSTLPASSTAVTSGASNTVTSNVAYTVSESLTGVPGYRQVGIACTDDATAAVVGTAGTVTLNEGQNVTCTITNEDIAPKITVRKVVVNNDGGNATIADFVLEVSPMVNATITSGTQYVAVANTLYTVSETQIDGYLLTSIVCTDDADGTTVVGAGGVFTPNEGQNVTCTMTNNDIAPKITVKKVVTNDDGGNAVVGDFVLSVVPSVVATVVSGTQNLAAANVEYTVSETQIPGYAQTSLVCVDDVDGTTSVGTGGVFTLDEGQNVTCTIANDDIAPKVRVVKVVTNNNGGNAVVADFALSVAPAVSATVVSGTQYSAESNLEYTVSETQIDGYLQTSLVCLDDADAATVVGAGGVFTLDEGQNVTCTITNDDVAPKVRVVKVVTNDDGGNAVVGDFVLDLSGVTVTSGVSNTVAANLSYTVSEVQIVGYTQTSLVCVDDKDGTTPVGVAGVFTLDEGQNVTCTITNDDVAPKLTVKKVVNNPNGGNAVVTDFPLTLASTDPVSSAPVTSGIQNQVSANVNYTVSEDLAGTPGYRQVSIACVDDVTNAAAGLSGSVLLTEGQNVTCTIVNEDIPPRITVNKVVTNDDGGNAEIEDFVLTASVAISQTAIVSGTQYVATSNTAYTIGEDLTSTPGYTQVSIVCEDDVTGLTVGTGGAFTPVEGQDVTCTITNDDVAPKVKVVKVVTNNNGGNAVVADFVLGVVPSVAASVVSGTQYSAEANVEYTVSETLVAGYAQTSLVCVDDKDGTTSVGVAGVFTLDEGQDVTCTITNDDVAPKVKVVKVVTNDDGGNAVVADFVLDLSGVTVTSGVSNTVAANQSYTVSETQIPGYTQTSLVCVDDKDGTTPVGVAGVFTLDEGQDVTCTITNDDIAPKLTVVKTVINNHDGEALPDDFELTAEPFGPVTSGIQNTVTANTTYTVSETLVADYRQVSLGCVDDLTDAAVGTAGVLSLNEGQNVTCTIVNDDIGTTITVVKDVINNDGGNASAADFALNLSGIGAVTSGVPENVAADVEYVVTETNIPGYTMTGIECLDDDTGDVVGADGVVTPGPDQFVTCTITNDDVAPKVKVVKVVTNDDGGNAVVADFVLDVSGLTVTSDVSNTVMANQSYTVSETQIAGYTQTSLVCVDDKDGTTPVGTGGVFTLNEGQNVTCTITNDDIAPKVRVVKVVTNNNGGNAVIGDFALTVVPSVRATVVSGTQYAADANVEYAVSETQIAGYTQTSLVCVDDADGTTPVGTGGVFTLNEGQNVTCTITNDDVAPKVKVVKVVTNDDGGNAVVADFVLDVSGLTVTSGVSNTVTANQSYTVSETQIAGYTQTSIVCQDDLTTLEVGAAGTLLLNEGQHVTCTITNDDIAPNLTVNKVVNNPNGGNAVIADFPLNLASANPVSSLAIPSGVQRTVSSNVEYTVSEDLAGTPGYRQVSISCVDDTTLAAVGLSGSVRLDEGQSVTCTIINEDIPPRITIIKNVTNDDGGNAVVADFELTADPVISVAPIISGTQYVAKSNVAYIVDEDLAATPGYAQVSIVCEDDVTGDTVGAGGSFTPVEGQDVTCTITNDDIAPTVKVVKVVVNDDGGNAVVGDFELDLSGRAVVSGVSTTVAANQSYTVSETRIAGYTQTSLVCVDDKDGTTAVGTGGVFTLIEGQRVTCTMTNDDIAPTVKVVKVVVNDDGGNAAVGDFVLDVSGDTVVSGATSTVEANAALVVSETPLAGYTQTSLSCIDDDSDAVVGTAGRFTPSEGQHITCTITNDDIAPKLTVVKEVINDHGDTRQPVDFVLNVSDLGRVVSGAPNTVEANVRYEVSEEKLAGYEQVSIECVDDDTEQVVGTAGVVTLSEGQHVTCTIVNDDDPQGVITVTKRTSEPTAVAFPFEFSDLAFELAASATRTFDDLDPGTYTIEELVDQMPAGWRLASIECVEVNGPANLTTESLIEVVIGVGSRVDCTVTNEFFDLSITKRDLADPVLAGETVTYELAIDNVGSGLAKDPAVVADLLPLPLVWADVPLVQAPDGVTCADPIAQRLECTIPAELLDPTDPTVFIRVKADVPADVDPETVTNIAVVDIPDDPCTPKDEDGACQPTEEEDCTSSTTRSLAVRPLAADDGMASNVDCEDTEITPHVDLTIDKVFDGTTIAPGQAGTFTLIVTNNGPGKAVDVVVTDPVPAPLVVTGADGAGNPCQLTGNTMRCSKPTMAIGEKWTLKVNVVLPASASSLPANYVNVAEVLTPGDEDPDNNEDDAPVAPPKRPTLPTTGADPHLGSRVAVFALAGGFVFVLLGRRRRRRTLPVCLR